MKKKQKTRKGMLNLKLFLIFAVFTVLISSFFGGLSILIYSVGLSGEYDKNVQQAIDYINYIMVNEHLDSLRHPEKVTKKEKEEILEDLDAILYTVSGNAAAIYGLDSVGKPAIIAELSYEDVEDDFKFSNYDGYDHTLIFEEQEDGTTDLIVECRSIGEIKYEEELLGYAFVSNKEHTIENFFGVFIVATILIGFVVAFFSLMFSMIASAMIIKPIDKLITQVVRFGTDGSAEIFKSRIRTGDEIQTLQEAFSDMAKRLREATIQKIREATDKERELTQYKDYRQMKERMTCENFDIPPEYFVKMYSMDLITSKLEVNCCNYLLRKDGKVAFVMASMDESGIMPTMGMAIAMVIIRSYILSDMDLETCVSEINRQLFINMSENKYVSVYFGMIDPSVNMLYTINCGGAPAIISDKKRNLSMLTGRIYEPLGLSENVSYRAESRKITEGDTIYINNGTLDLSKNTEGEKYGIERVKAILENIHYKNENIGELLEIVERDIVRFLKGSKLESEVLILAVSYLKPEKKRAEKSLRPNMNNLSVLQDFIRLQLMQNEINPKVNALMRVITEELFHIYCINTYGDEINTIIDIDSMKYMKLEMSSRAKGGKDAFDEEKEESISFIKRNTDKFEVIEDGEKTTVLLEKQL